MPTNHAILSPSASKRWMTCTPSARAEQGCADATTTFAMEGTLAHKCGEVLLIWLKDSGLKYCPDAESFTQMLPDGTVDQLYEVKDALNELLQGTDADFNDMLDTVYENYVMPVFEDYLKEKAEDPEAQLLVEAELKLDSFIPEGFGSSDAVIISGGSLHVYDLKYGKGVKVEAENNPQMMCYALGAALGPAELYCVDYVTMTIIQPRLQHISSATMSWQELHLWATKTLRPAAEKAFNGEGEYVAGDHCKFCKFAPRCRACAARAKVTAEIYGEPERLTDEELGQALSTVESIKGWLSRLEEYAITYVTSGHKIPGWKAVEGRSIRKITDQQACLNELVNAGFEREMVLKAPELKTITDLEKMLGKSGKAILSPYIEKPQGKPTIVPESDKRPEFVPAAKNDFE